MTHFQFSMLLGNMFILASFFADGYAGLMLAAVGGIYALSGILFK